MLHVPRGRRTRARQGRLHRHADPPRDSRGRPRARAGDVRLHARAPGIDGRGRVERRARDQRSRRGGAAAADGELPGAPPARARQSGGRPRGHAGLRAVRIPQRGNGRRLRLRRSDDLPRRLERALRNSGAEEARAADSLSEGRLARRPDPQRGIVPQARLQRRDDAAIELYHDRGALYDAMSADAAETNGVDRVLEQIYKYAK